MEKLKEYEKQDKILCLEQGLEDLKQLCQHQANTISGLHKESSLKSQKILQLQKLSGRAAVSVETGNVFQPKMLLSSVLSSQRSTTTHSDRQARPPAQAVIDTAKMAEKKILQLQEEKDFWRRHFESADLDLKELRSKIEKLPLKEISINISDNVNKIAEEEEEENGGTYVKKLLEENIQLKEKIERLSRKRDQKENLPEPGVKQVNFGNRQPLADHRPPSAGHRPPSAVLRPPSANKQPSQICAGKTAPNVWQRMQSYRPPGPRARAASFRPRGPTVRPRRPAPVGGACSAAASDQCPYESTRIGHSKDELQHLAEHNKCLMNQVYSLKEELERRAVEISCCCENRPPGAQKNTTTCDQCPKMTCRNEAGVRFEDALDPGLVHLCDHIKCLQRQVCHLQNNLTRAEATSKELTTTKSDLATASSEVRHLSDRVSSLLEEKKANLDTITNLNRKVDGLLGTVPQETKVRNLIQDIEVQRDRYKIHVETLISQLQTNRINPRVTFDDLDTGERGASSQSLNQQLSGSRVTLDEVDNSRQQQQQKQQQQQQPKERRVSFVEEGGSGPEDQLRQTRIELHESKMENLTLRRELMDCLSQLQQPGEKGTQTSPRPSPQETLQLLTKEKSALKEARVLLTKEQENLKLDKLKLEAERSVFANKMTSAPPLSNSTGATPPPIRSVGAAPPHTSGTEHSACREEAQRLEVKITQVEKQLENTENALRTNQNLISESSGRAYELNSKILQLKQSLGQANRTGDELRTRLDKKDDFIRRVMDDKSELFDKLTTTKDRLVELELELADTRDKMVVAQEQKSNLEKKQRLEAASLEKREKAAESQDRLRDDLVRSENSGISLQTENDALKKDNAALRSRLEMVQTNLDERKIEVAQLNSQLQIYIAEVRRVEDLLADKEGERRRLLDQYEELAKEAHHADTVNRSLEMQAANLQIEIKGKQSDLETARSRCSSLEEYVEEILRQNETFRTQIISLNAKVDMLTSDLQDNRIARDSVLTDLDGVNHLVVKLNTDKVDLLHRISEQNSDVENLQKELASLREELLKAMAGLEDERHRARTLQDIVTSTHTQESRETVIRELESQKLHTVQPEK